MKKENTDKANQHYVPKFYLRNFSYKNNLKQIGIYNTGKGMFYQTASLKYQASKKYLYGKDGNVENFYQSLENILAPLLKEYINEKIPRQFSYEHPDMLNLIVLMEVRNPVGMELQKKSFLAIKQKLMDIDPSFLDSSQNNILNSEFGYEEIHRFQLQCIEGIILMAMDLGFKLLKNVTDTPFISSDFPVVRYNQFMENNDWGENSYNGSGWKGQQILFPLNSKYLLILYDQDIYKVGSKKEKVVEIDSKESINSINMLQVLNCTNTIFFNDQASEGYIEILVRKSKKYKKGNKAISYEARSLNDDGTEKENSRILVSSISNIENNLNIQKVKIHTKGKRTKLNDYALQMRPKAREMYTYLKKNNKYGF